MFHTGGKANISNTTQQNREGLKKRFLGGKFSQCEPTHRPTHPRVFVRFGKTKGEIQVKKGDFRVDLGGSPK